jgi:hypothetical protein
MPDGKKRRIMDACKGTEIHFLQAIIVRDQKDGTGKPPNVRLIPTDHFPNFLEMVDFFTEEKYIEESKRPIPLRSLEDLPYYANDREWVEQYRRNRNARQAMQ